MSSPQQLSQLQSPLLDPEHNENTMTRQQPLQLISNSCENDDEHDLPGNDGIFRVIQQHQNEQVTLNGNDIHEYDDCDDNFATHLSPPQWYQQPQQLSAMLSNFSTSYNAVNVSLVLPILKVVIIDNRDDGMSSSFVSQQQHASSLVADAEAAVASSLLAGMIVGQIFGGVLGDLVGPSVALRLVMFLQIIASIGSSCSDLLSLQSMSSSSSLRIYWHLAVWRFILGIGAGGVYPLAAVLSASTEPNKQTNMDCNTKHNQTNTGNVCDTDTFNHTDENNKLHRVVLTFSTQGLGFITVPIVAVILLHLIPSNLDVVWRLLLGLGSVPGIFLLILQWRYMHTDNSRQALPSQERERFNITDTAIDQLDINNALEGDSNGNENGSFLCTIPALDQLNNGVGERPEISTPSSVLTGPQSTETKSWWESICNEENLGYKLLGTAATWFLFDVLFYGNTLFQPIVMQAAFGTAENADSVHILQHTARNSLILTSIALPGYIVASAVLGKSSVWCYCGVEQTPRFVMMQGFGVMAVLYFAIGSAWDSLRHYPSVLVLMYSLTFFFANFGPNTTTFVLPSLVFSEECRSTFNGLSAAAGKLGALTGATLFEPASDRLGNASVMLLCSSISVVALILTKYFVPISTYHSSNNAHHHNHIHTRVPADAEVE